jgi:hypothetical protein
MLVIGRFAAEIALRLVKCGAGTTAKFGAVHCVLQAKRGGLGLNALVRGAEVELLIGWRRRRHGLEFCQPQMRRMRRFWRVVAS